MMKGNVIPLREGKDTSTPSLHEEMKRIADLRATVEHYLPEFVEFVKNIKKGKVDSIAIHQDAFAAGYDKDEYILLGMMIKYAGLEGVKLSILGNNHETW